MLLSTFVSAHGLNVCKSHTLPVPKPSHAQLRPAGVIKVIAELGAGGCGAGNADEANDPSDEANGNYGGVRALGVAGEGILVVVAPK